MSEWISVEEPPKKSGLYLVTSLYKDEFYITPYTAHYWIEDNKWDHSVLLWFKTGPIPLPEPPNEN